MARAFNQLLSQLQETLRSVDEATEGMLTKSETLNSTASRSNKSVVQLAQETQVSLCRKP